MAYLEIWLNNVNFEVTEFYTCMKVFDCNSCYKFICLDFWQCCNFVFNDMMSCALMVFTCLYLRLFCRVFSATYMYCYPVGDKIKSKLELILWSQSANSMNLIKQSLMRRDLLK